MDLNFTLITGRDPKITTSPRLAVDLIAEGTSCSPIRRTAEKLLSIGRLLAGSEVGRSLPHVQYGVHDKTSEHISSRIIRTSDLIEATKSKDAPVKVFARGRLIAGDDAIDRCFPKMSGGPEGETWEQMYGVPDPRPEVMQQLLPMFEAAERLSEQRRVAEALAVKGLLLSSTHDWQLADDQLQMLTALILLKELNDGVVDKSRVERLMRCLKSMPRDDAARVQLIAAAALCNLTIR